jgi:hypothetical protein
MDEEAIAARTLYIVNFTFVQRLREKGEREEKEDGRERVKRERRERGTVVKPDKK